MDEPLGPPGRELRSRIIAGVSVQERKASLKSRKKNSSWLGDAEAIFVSDTPQDREEHGSQTSEDEGEVEFVRMGRDSSPRKFTFSVFSKRITRSETGVRAAMKETGNGASEKEVIAIRKSIDIISKEPDKVVTDHRALGATKATTERKRGRLRRYPNAEVMTLGLRGGGGGVITRTNIAVLQDKNTGGTLEFENKKLEAKDAHAEVDRNPLASEVLETQSVQKTKKAVHFQNLVDSTSEQRQNLGSLVQKGKIVAKNMPKMVGRLTRGRKERAVAIALSGGYNELDKVDEGPRAQLGLRTSEKGAERGNEVAAERIRNNVKETGSNLVAGDESNATYDEGSRAEIGVEKEVLAMRLTRGKGKGLAVQASLCDTSLVEIAHTGTEGQRVTGGTEIMVETGIEVAAERIIEGANGRGEEIAPSKHDITTATGQQAAQGSGLLMNSRRTETLLEKVTKFVPERMTRGKKERLLKNALANGLPVDLESTATRAETLIQVLPERITRVGKDKGLAKGKKVDENLRSETNTKRVGTRHEEANNARVERINEGVKEKAFESDYLVIASLTASEKNEEVTEVFAERDVMECGEASNSSHDKTLNERRNQGMNGRMDPSSIEERSKKVSKVVTKGLTRGRKEKAVESDSPTCDTRAVTQKAVEVLGACKDISSREVSTERPTEVVGVKLTRGRKEKETETYIPAGVTVPSRGKQTERAEGVENSIAVSLKVGEIVTEEAPSFWKEDVASELPASVTSKPTGKKLGSDAQNESRATREAERVAEIAAERVTSGRIQSFMVFEAAGDNTFAAGHTLPFEAHLNIQREEAVAEKEPEAVAQGGSTLKALNTSHNQVDVGKMVKHKTIAGTRVDSVLAKKGRKSGTAEKGKRKIVDSSEMGAVESQRDDRGGKSPKVVGRLTRGMKERGAKSREGVFLELVGTKKCKPVQVMAALQQTVNVELGDVNLDQMVEGESLHLPLKPGENHGNRGNSEISNYKVGEDVLLPVSKNETLILPVTQEKGSTDQHTIAKILPVQSLGLTLPSTNNLDRRDEENEVTCVSKVRVTTRAQVDVVAIAQKYSAILRTADATNRNEVSQRTRLMTSGQGVLDREFVSRNTKRSKLSAGRKRVDKLQLRRQKQNNIDSEREYLNNEAAMFNVGLKDRKEASKDLARKKTGDCLGTLLDEVRAEFSPTAEVRQEQDIGLQSLRRTWPRGESRRIREGPMESIASPTGCPTRNSAEAVEPYSRILNFVDSGLERVKIAKTIAGKSANNVSKPGRPEPVDSETKRGRAESASKVTRTEGPLDGHCSLLDSRTAEGTSLGLGETKLDASPSQIQKDTPYSEHVCESIEGKRKPGRPKGSNGKNALEVDRDQNFILTYLQEGLPRDLSLPSSARIQPGSEPLLERNSEPAQQGEDIYDGPAATCSDDTTENTGEVLADELRRIRLRNKILPDRKTASKAGRKTVEALTGDAVSPLLKTLSISTTAEEFLDRPLDRDDIPNLQISERTEEPGSPPTEETEHIHDVRLLELSRSQPAENVEVREGILLGHYSQLESSKEDQATMPTDHEIPIRSSVGGSKDLPNALSTSHNSRSALVSREAIPMKIAGVPVFSFRSLLEGALGFSLDESIIGRPCVQSTTQTEAPKVAQVETSTNDLADFCNDEGHSRQPHCGGSASRNHIDFSTGMASDAVPLIVEEEREASCSVQLSGAEILGQSSRDAEMIAEDVGSFPVRDEDVSDHFEVQDLVEEETLPEVDSEKICDEPQEVILGRIARDDHQPDDGVLQRVNDEVEEERHSLNSLNDSGCEKELASQSKEEIEEELTAEIGIGAEVKGDGLEIDESLEASSVHLQVQDSIIEDISVQAEIMPIDFLTTGRLSKIELELVALERENLENQKSTVVNDGFLAVQSGAQPRAFPCPPSPHDQQNALTCRESSKGDEESLLLVKVVAAVVLEVRPLPVDHLHSLPHHAHRVSKLDLTQEEENATQKLGLSAVDFNSSLEVVPPQGNLEVVEDDHQSKCNSHLPTMEYVSENSFLPEGLKGCALVEEAKETANLDIATIMTPEGEIKSLNPEGRRETLLPRLEVSPVVVDVEPSSDEVHAASFAPSVTQQDAPLKAEELSVSVADLGVPVVDCRESVRLSEAVEVFSLKAVGIDRVPWTVQGNPVTVEIHTVLDDAKIDAAEAGKGEVEPPLVGSNRIVSLLSITQQERGLQSLSVSSNPNIGDQTAKIFLHKERPVAEPLEDSPLEPHFLDEGVGEPLAKSPCVQGTSLQGQSSVVAVEEKDAQEPAVDAVENPAPSSQPEFTLQTDFTVPEAKPVEKDIEGKSGSEIPSLETVATITTLHANIENHSTFGSPTVLVDPEQLFAEGGFTCTSIEVADSTAVSLGLVTDATEQSLVEQQKREELHSTYTNLKPTGALVRNGSTEMEDDSANMKAFRSEEAVIAEEATFLFSPASKEERLPEVRSVEVIDGIDSDAIPERVLGNQMQLVFQESDATASESLESFKVTYATFGQSSIQQEVDKEVQSPLAKKLGEKHIHICENETLPQIEEQLLASTTENPLLKQQLGCLELLTYKHKPSAKDQPDLAELAQVEIERAPHSDFKKRKRLSNSGVRRVRPRPIDPDQSIMVFVEGRDKVEENDGGALCRWLQQQNEGDVPKGSGSKSKPGKSFPFVGAKVPKQSVGTEKPMIAIPSFRFVTDYEERQRETEEKKQAEMGKPMSTAYGKFVASMLGRPSDYDMDDEDEKWLRAWNDRVNQAGLRQSLSEDKFEEIIEYLERALAQMPEELQGATFLPFTLGAKSFLSAPSKSFAPSMVGSTATGLVPTTTITYKSGGQVQPTASKLNATTLRTGHPPRSGKAKDLQRAKGHVIPAAKDVIIARDAASPASPIQVHTGTSVFEGSPQTPADALAQRTLKGSSESSFENPKSFLQKPSDECCICNGGEDDENNPVYTCKQCFIHVHQSCYGIREKFRDDYGQVIAPPNWCCRKCEAVVAGSAEPNLSCALCRKKGGALKPTVEPQKWAHVACALYTSETFFVDPEAMEPIDGIAEVEARVEKRQDRCGLCGVKKGTCSNCFVKGCAAPFHISCGVSQGASFELRPSKQKVVGVIAFCPRHAGATPMSHRAFELLPSIGGRDSFMVTTSTTSGMATSATAIGSISTTSSMDNKEVGSSWKRLPHGKDGVSKDPISHERMDGDFSLLGKGKGKVMGKGLLPGISKGRAKGSSQSEEIIMGGGKMKGPSIDVDEGRQLTPLILKRKWGESFYQSERKKPTGDREDRAIEVIELSKSKAGMPVNDTQGGVITVHRSKQIIDEAGNDQHEKRTKSKKVGKVGNVKVHISPISPMVALHERGLSSTSLEEPKEPSRSAGQAVGGVSVNEVAYQVASGISANVEGKDPKELIENRFANEVKELIILEEAMKAEVAPPHIMREAFVYWRAKRAKHNGSLLRELQHEQWSKALGIFNKAGTLEKLGEMPDLPSYVPPTRQPRPGLNDDMWEKTVEFRKQLELVRTINRVIVQREKLKYKEQLVLGDMATLQLSIAQGPMADRHCVWCPATKSLLNCETCPRSFCFNCFKHRQGFGVKGWVAALKQQPMYSCYYCQESALDTIGVNCAPEPLFISLIGEGLMGNPVYKGHVAQSTDPLTGAHKPSLSNGVEKEKGRGKGKGKGKGQGKGKGCNGSLVSGLSGSVWDSKLPEEKKMANQCEALSKISLSNYINRGHSLLERSSFETTLRRMNVLHGLGSYAAPVGTSTGTRGPKNGRDFSDLQSARRRDVVGEVKENGSSVPVSASAPEWLVYKKKRTWDMGTTQCARDLEDVSLDGSPKDSGQAHGKGADVTFRRESSPRRTNSEKVIKLSELRDATTTSESPTANGSLLDTNPFTSNSNSRDALVDRAGNTQHSLKGKGHRQNGIAKKGRPSGKGTATATATSTVPFYDTRRYADSLADID